jgi:signal transduction histidine kinase
MSSLLAWIDLMEDDAAQANDLAFAEMRKDMDRLQIITERFSKIGSDPVLSDLPINDVLQNAVGYMQNRAPKSISIALQNSTTPIFCEINIPLFEWVVENLVKNAIDAMKEGTGSIDIKLFLQKNKAIIEFKDSGSGVPPSKFKTVFNPGYTTKKRGWGLGLSLVKRIIEHYHKGLIYIKESVINKGTTFKIVLPLSKNG